MNLKSKHPQLLESLTSIDGKDRSKSRKPKKRR